MTTEVNKVEKEEKKQEKGAGEKNTAKGLENLRARMLWKSRKELDELVVPIEEN